MLVAASKERGFVRDDTRYSDLANVTPRRECESGTSAAEAARGLLVLCRGRSHDLQRLSRRGAELGRVTNSRTTSRAQSGASHKFKNDVEGAERGRVTNSRTTSRAQSGGESQIQKRRRGRRAGSSHKFKKNGEEPARRRRYAAHDSWDLIEVPEVDGVAELHADLFAAFGIAETVDDLCFGAGTLVFSTEDDGAAFFNGAAAQ